MQPSFWHIFGLKSSWAVNHFFHVIYCAYNPEAFVHIYVQNHPSSFVTLASPKASSAALTRGKSSGETAVSACEAELRTCLRCGSQYSVEDNSPVACRYHGHMTGELPFVVYCPSGMFLECAMAAMLGWLHEANSTTSSAINQAAMPLEIQSRNKFCLL